MAAAAILCFLWASDRYRAPAWAWLIAGAAIVIDVPSAVRGVAIVAAWLA